MSSSLWTTCANRCLTTYGSVTFPIIASFCFLSMIFPEKRAVSDDFFGGTGEMVNSGYRAYNFKLNGEGGGLFILNLRSSGCCDTQPPPVRQDRAGRSLGAAEARSS